MKNDGMKKKPGRPKDFYNVFPKRNTRNSVSNKIRNIDFQKAIDSDQRLFNFLSDNGFITLESDRAEIRRIIANEIAPINPHVAIGFEMVNKHGDPTSIELVEKHKLDAAEKRIKELEDALADLYETIDPKEIKRKLHETD